jgi:hypothetical protein
MPVTPLRDGETCAVELHTAALPCTQAWYEAANGGPVAVVPLATYVDDVQCPFPKPLGGNMSLPSWLYFAGASC